MGNEHVQSGAVDIGNEGDGASAGPARNQEPIGRHASSPAIVALPIAPSNRLRRSQDRNTAATRQVRASTRDSMPGFKRAMLPADSSCGSAMRRFDHARPVLVVDDNDEVRDGLKALLESAGFCVVVVRGGREALQAIRSGDVVPCLVVLDLMMPLFDGWDVLAELNGDTDLAAIPVIVLSAHPLATLAMNAGAVAVLSKPTDPEVLIGAVDRHARYAVDSPS